MNQRYFFYLGIVALMIITAGYTLHALRENERSWLASESTVTLSESHFINVNSGAQ